MAGERSTILGRFPRDRTYLLPALHAIQHAERWLSRSALEAAAAHLRVPSSEVWGVATHYPEFRLTEPGDRLIRVCTGLACSAAGAGDVLARLSREAGPGVGRTSRAGLTLETTDCAFACSVAPVVVVERQPYGRLTPEQAARLIRDAASPIASAPSTVGSGDRRGANARVDEAPTLLVGIGTCTRAVGADATLAALRDAVERRGLSWTVAASGCSGACWAAPAVTVRRGTNFAVIPSVGAHEVPRLLAAVENGQETSWARECAAYFAAQRRLLMRDCGVIDATDIAEAMTRGRYAAFSRELQSGQPVRILERVKTAGLTGRGGAYFPTAVKWEACRAAAGEPKYVVLNAEEGEPGIFKDRHLLEADPHRVLEGVLLAAFAVGASHGILYVHGEADLAAERLTLAVDQARAARLLGTSILGTSFAFDVEIRRGAGGFVLGEETALLESLEGRRAMPRTRPPFPAEAGLFGKPTVINNVETLVGVVSVVEADASALRTFGNGAGTKLFGLAGHVRRPGILEMELGCTLRTLLDAVGGSRTGRPIVSAVVGGPSGSIVPARSFDVPLVPRGAVNPGTGGVVALDETYPIHDVVKSLLAFNARESCGKCTPCREGTARLLAMLDAPLDTGRAAELAQVIQVASLCGLGQAAPLSLLSALAEFPDAFTGATAR